MFQAVLTGGIASGKSTVGAMFRELGVYVLESDHLARQAVEYPSPLLFQLAENFGPQVLDEHGCLRRNYLRNIVFNDEAARLRLNHLLHPHIKKMLLEEVNRIKDPQAIVLLDVPLLFEVGWQHDFSTIILVYVPPAIQLERLMRRDRLDQAAAEIALRAQMPIDKKKNLAQIIIDNSGLLSETLAQVQDVWFALQKMSTPQPC